MYRSYIQGNTRARAIWVFNGITPDTIGDKLILESRFEAFRTNKGTEKSVGEGLEAQYTLVHNPRDLAFSDMPAAASMKDFSDALKAGQFRAASDRIADLAERIRSSPDDIPAATARLAAGLVRASEVLAIIDEPLKPGCCKDGTTGKGDVGGRKVV